VEADDGSTCRYCLAERTQAGPSAVYAFVPGLVPRGIAAQERSAAGDAEIRELAGTD
jgi:hypothetical protein